MINRDAPVESGPEDRQPSDMISLIEMVNMVLRHPRLVFGLPVLLASMLVLMAALSGPRFLATSKFKPHVATTGPSQLAGLAAQFGVSLGAAGAGESVEFYEQVLQSNDLREEVARSDYTITSPDGEAVSGTLLELIDFEGDTEEERLLDALEYLGKITNIRLDLSAGVVTLTTRAAVPALAVQLNRRMLELLNRFNLESRQTQASREREFVEARLRETRVDLQNAEAELAEFLRSNVAYEQSPQLTFEAARLRRQVDISQQVYTSLAQAYEQARIDEVRNIPVFTVIDAPEGLTEESYELLRDGALGFILGALLGIVLALALEYFARQRHDYPRQFREFRRLARLQRFLPQRRQAAKESLD